MKKEKMIKEVERLYFMVEGGQRLIATMNKNEKELKSKNAELLKENNSLRKELKEAKKQIEALQQLQNANVETTNTINTQEFLQNSLQFLTKAMELSKINIAGVLNK